MLNQGLQATSEVKLHAFGLRFTFSGLHCVFNVLSEFVAFNLVSCADCQKLCRVNKEDYSEHLF